MTLFGRVKIM